MGHPRGKQPYPPPKSNYLHIFRCRVLAVGRAPLELWYQLLEVWTRRSSQTTHLDSKSEPCDNKIAVSKKNSVERSKIDKRISAISDQNFSRQFSMTEEGGGKEGKGKGDVSVCRDFLRNVCTRGERCVVDRTFLDFCKPNIAVGVSLLIQRGKTLPQED